MLETVGLHKSCAAVFLLLPGRNVKRQDWPCGGPAQRAKAQELRMGCVAGCLDMQGRHVTSAQRGWLLCQSSSFKHTGRQGCWYGAD